MTHLRKMMLEDAFRFHIVVRGNHFRSDIGRGRGLDACPRLALPSTPKGPISVDLIAYFPDVYDIAKCIHIIFRAIQVFGHGVTLHVERIDDLAHDVTEFLDRHGRIPILARLLTRGYRRP